uniref:Uncharacterized protein n=1 Tax=Zea mays TaxID=4577 RepID=C4J2G8_MAIZE|nr:unknown [Zea mays]
MVALVSSLHIYRLLQDFVPHH